MSVRIHQLSKDIGMENKELIKLLKSRGYEVKSASSTVDNISADALREEFASQAPAEPETDSAEAKKEEVPAAPKMPEGAFVKSAADIERERKEKLAAAEAARKGETVKPASAGEASTAKAAAAEEKAPASEAAKSSTPPPPPRPPCAPPAFVVTKAAGCLGHRGLCGSPQAGTTAAPEPRSPARSCRRPHRAQNRAKHGAIHRAGHAHHGAPDDHFDLGGQAFIN